MNRIIVLDKSGSMESIRNDTIGGYNAFVESQAGGTLSLYLFSDSLKKVYSGVPVSEVPKMTRETFVPNGGTALYDAVGKVILDHLADSVKPTVVIITDGEENSSRNYSKSAVKDMIKKTGWDFVYLGQNIEEGTDIGIQTSRPFDTEATMEGFTRLGAAMTMASQTGSSVAMD
jgi:uncharacterized protein with von Willebrand factor type A (vWA) domain